MIVSEILIQEVQLTQRNSASAYLFPLITVCPNYHDK